LNPSAAAAVPTTGLAEKAAPEVAWGKAAA
jgi:hypothetical protein